MREAPGLERMGVDKAHSKGQRQPMSERAGVLFSFLAFRCDRGSRRSSAAEALAQETEGLLEQESPLGRWEVVKTLLVWAD